MATTEHAQPDALELVLELAALQRPAWSALSDAIPAWHPRNEGDDDDGDGSGTDDDQDDDAAGGTDDDQDDDDDSAGDGGSGDGGKKVDWKAESRKHEARAKRERKARDATEKKLREREDADKTAEQKAIDDAKAAGRQEASGEFEKTRRADRLEVAVTRLTTRGIKVGEGDKAKTVKFADPEDVLMYLERRIARGDIDADDVYDADGKVDVAALTTELADLAADKPGWLVDSAAGRSSAADADSDAGKGNSGSGDDSVEAHFTKVRRHKP